MKFIPEDILDYKSFIQENRKRVNGYLNVVLWCCILTGPALAVGIATGVFTGVTYLLCAEISLVMFALAVAHLLLTRQWPGSIVTSVFALVAMNLLLVYMNFGHISINLTWFLMPLLSLLFCDGRIYAATLVVNYLLMGLSTWLVAPYHVAQRQDFASDFAYFATKMGGYTIETLIMAGAGVALGRVAAGYFKEMLAKHKTIMDHQDQMREQFETLDSMSQIYDKVNLIDFEKMTERHLSDEDMPELPINLGRQTHTEMTMPMIGSIVQDQMADFVAFTDLTTLRQRLTDEKNITSEFIDKKNGWFRAQYIKVESDDAGVPKVVIFTTQNIENEKRREEHLIRIAMTDGLTRLNNRRCYEEDIKKYRQEKLEQDFVLFSVDVNELKTANDTKGHAAGDELIKGAADCLLLSVGATGKVYRTGGDEFIAMVRTDDAEGLAEEIKEKAAEWHGKLIDILSLSVGYAAYADHPDADIDKLERYADKMMYRDKAEYYRINGIDRRQH